MYIEIPRSPSACKASSYRKEEFLGNQGVAPAMLAFDLSPGMIRKGVTVLRLTSIDKLTELELHLSVPRLVQLQNNRHSLQQILSLRYTHYQAQTSLCILFKSSILVHKI